MREFIKRRSNQGRVEWDLSRAACEDTGYVTFERRMNVIVLSQSLNLDIEMTSAFL